MNPDVGTRRSEEPDWRKRTEAGKFWPMRTESKRFFSYETLNMKKCNLFWINYPINIVLSCNKINK